MQFLTSFKDNEYVYLAFEWLPGGDLYSLMSAQTLTELQAKFYAAQMLMALDCLHAVGERFSLANASDGCTEGSPIEPAGD